MRQDALIWQLQAKLKRLERENLSLNKHITELKDKLVKSIYFFQNFAPEINLPSVSFVSKITTMNECLREALTKLNTPVRVCPMKCSKAKSFDQIESDEENSPSGVSTAIKLLTIKYHFERYKERSLNKQGLQDKAKIPHIISEAETNSKDVKKHNDKIDASDDEISVENHNRLSSYSS
eukprot:TRINITY_DN3473_c0_g4_i1.p2 TRINITY_DN3473_c0_g4~~TRINITY_DN3473_c0_g4_i1.p2  ORF type:complete len:179 (-),score=20.53 TRINITY_DN3473_c0_g4_i1:73-609(-)